MKRNGKIRNRPTKASLGALHVKIPRGKRKKGLFNIRAVNNYHSSLKRLVNGVF